VEHNWHSILSLINFVINKSQYKFYNWCYRIYYHSHNMWHILYVLARWRHHTDWSARTGK